jgi:plasmid stabilization system protein ParE
MTFRVEISARAERDLDRIFAGLARQASYHGIRWFDRFEQTILSLYEFPERCAVELELSTAQREVRKLLFGRRKYVYRVYFTITGDVVRVLHVRHGARREPKRV